MHQINRRPADSPAVAIGQTRADRHGATVIIIGAEFMGRYTVEYPQLEGERHVYSALTIEQMYPVIVSEAR